MKKSATLLLLTALAFSMLNACSTAQTAINEPTASQQTTGPNKTSIIPDGNWHIYCKGLCPDKTPCFSEVIEDALSNNKDIKCNCVTCQRVIEPINPEAPMPTDIDIPVDAPMLIGYATDYMKSKYHTDASHLGITDMWFSIKSNNNGKFLIEFIIKQENDETLIDAVYYDINYADNTRTIPSKVSFLCYENSDRDSRCRCTVDRERLTIYPTAMEGEKCGITILQMNLTNWNITPDFFKK